jgi:hypothetical protein
MTPLTDPEFLPFKLDLVSRRVLLVRLTPAQRHDAAFLDERALPARADGGWVPLEALLAQTSVQAACADAIFHIGHCGSTLLSRLLESWPQVQGLREPLPLRILAEAWPQLHAPESRLAPARSAARAAGVVGRVVAPVRWPPPQRGQGDQQLQRPDRAVARGAAFRARGAAGHAVAPLSRHAA